MPASWAIAGRCRPALVDPPVAATAAQAFSRLFRVTRSRGRGPPSARMRSTISPARRARARRWEYTAGSMAEPGTARPSVSDTIAMVLAVNWPGQEPTVGAHSSSIDARSASVIAPAITAPTPS